MKYKLLYLIIAAALVSCVDDAINGLSSQKPNEEAVPVTINLAVDSESNGIESSRSDQYGITRGVIDTEEGATEDNVTKVMNAWVLQYAGTGDDAKLVGLPQYLEAPDANGMKTLSPRLIPTTGSKSTIVVLANTFNSSLDFHEGTTLSELKALVSSVNNKYDVFGYKMSSSIANTDFYPMLNGYAESTISSSTTLSCSLRRNIARVIVDVRVKDNAVSLSSVALRGVPQTKFYFSNYTGFNEHCANAQTQFSFDDYEAMKSPESGGVAEADGYKKFSYTFYVPANMKGANSNDNELYKNVYAPLGATYLYISATYPDGSESAPIAYTFYLGANFKNDYNLECNKSYHYVINIDSKGIQRADPRITDMGTVDFTQTTERSNCYILNPPTVDGYSRVFKIPVSRVDEFWGGNGYEDISNNVLGTGETGKQWKIFPIWSDFDTNSTNKDNLNRPYFNITKKEGIGKDDYFEVQVSRGAKGNIVVGLMRVDADGKTLTNYLWSWHLWITEYNPDVAIPNINNNKSSYEVTDFLYDVTDGHICRLAGEAWTTGKYKNAVMMDRNIGALVPATQNSDPHYTGLVYQYGRKDPFPSTENFYSFNESGGASLVSKVNTIASSKLDVTGDVYITYLVQNPKTFVMSYDGKLTGSKYFPSSTDQSIVWYDPNVKFDTLNYPENGKSIFDPSPLGWKLITQDAMEEIVTKINNVTTNNNNYKYTTNCKNETTRKGFPSYTLDPPTKENEYRGLVYWPNVEPWLEQVPSNLIYFPVSMIRKNDTGVLDCIEVSFWLPKVTANSTTNSNEFLVGKTHPIEIYTCSRSYALNARCVKILPSTSN